MQGFFGTGSGGSEPEDLTRKGMFGAICLFGYFNGFSFIFSFYAEFCLIILFFLRSYRKEN